MALSLVKPSTIAASNIHHTNLDVAIVPADGGPPIPLQVEANMVGGVLQQRVRVSSSPQRLKVTQRSSTPSQLSPRRSALDRVCNKVATDKEILYHVRMALRWKMKQISCYFHFRPCLFWGKDVFGLWARTVELRKGRSSQLFGMDDREVAATLRVHFKMWLMKIEEFRQKRALDRCINDLSGQLAEEKVRLRIRSADWAETVQKCMQTFLGRDKRTNLTRQIFERWLRLHCFATVRKKGFPLLIRSQLAHVISHHFHLWARSVTSGVSEHNRLVHQQMTEILCERQEGALRRAAMIIVGKNETLLVTSTLVDWRHVVARSQRQKKKERTSQLATRVVMTMVGSQAKLLADGVFTAWRKRAYRSHSLARRVVMKVVESQLRLVAKGVFAAWRGVSMAIQAAERVVGNMADNQVKLLAEGIFTVFKEWRGAQKAQKSATRIVTAMVDGFSGTSDKVAMAGTLREWHHVVQRGRAYRARLQARRVVLSMVGSNVTLKKECIFAAWRGAVRASLIAKRFVMTIADSQARLVAEGIFAVFAAWRGAHNKKHAARRIVMTMIDGQVRLLSESAFAAWRRLMLQRKIAVENFVGKQDKVLMASTLLEWCRLQHNAAGERFFKAHQSATQVTKSARRVVMSIVDTQGRLLEDAVFLAWKQRRHTNRLELKRMKQMMGSVGMMVGQKTNFSLALVFNAWRSTKAVNHGILNTALQLCALTLCSKDQVLCLQTFRAWKEEMLNLEIQAWAMRSMKTVKHFVLGTALQICELTVCNKDQVLYLHTFAAWKDEMRSMQSLVNTVHHAKSIKQAALNTAVRICEFTLCNEDKVMYLQIFLAWKEEMELLRKKEARARHDIATWRMVLFRAHNYARRLLYRTFMNWSRLSVACAILRRKQRDRNVYLLVLTNFKRSNVVFKAFACWVKYIADANQLVVQCQAQQALIASVQKTARRQSIEALGATIEKLASSEDQVLLANVFSAWSRVRNQEKLLMQSLHMMFGNNTTFILRETIQSWKQVTELERQNRIMNHVRLTARRQSVEALGATIQKLASTESQVLLANVFSAWSRVRNQEKLLMQSLHMMFGNNTTFILREAIQSWKQVTELERQHRIMNHVKLTARRQSVEALGATIQKLASTENQVLLANVWTAWSRVQNQEKLLKQSLHMMFGNNTSLIKKEAMQAWQQATRMEKQESMMTSAKLAARRKSVEALGATIQKLASTENQVLLGNVFSAWSRVRNQEKLLKQSLHMMFGNNTTLIKQEAIQAWHQFVKTKKITQSYRRRGSDVVGAAIQKLAEAENSALLKNTFFTWSRSHEDMRKARKNVMSFLMTDTKFMLSKTFAEWKQVVGQTRQKKGQSFILSMMATESDTGILSNAIQCWARFLSDVRKAKATAAKVFTFMVSQRSRLLVDCFFVAWSLCFVESQSKARLVAGLEQQSKEMKLQQNEARQQMALILLGGKCGFLTSSVLHQWRTVACDERTTWRSHYVMSSAFALSEKAIGLRRFLMLWMNYHNEMKRERLEVERMLACAKKDKAEVIQKNHVLRSMSLAVRARLMVIVEFYFRAWADRVAKLLQFRQKNRWLIRKFGDQFARAAYKDCFQSWSYSLKTCKRLPVYLKQVMGTFMRNQKSFMLMVVHTWSLWAAKSRQTKTANLRILAALMLGDSNSLLLRTIAAWRKEFDDARHTKLVNSHTDEIQQRTQDNESIMSILTSGHTAELRHARAAKLKFVAQALETLIAKDVMALRRLVILAWRDYMLRSMDSKYKTRLLKGCKGDVRRTLELLQEKLHIAVAISWFITWILHCRQIRRARVILKELADRRVAAYGMLDFIGQSRDANTLALAIGEWARVTRESLGQDVLEKYKLELMFKMQVATAQTLLRHRQAALSMHEARRHLCLSQVVGAWRAEAVSHCRFYELQLRVHQALRFQRASWTRLLDEGIREAMFVAVPMCFELWRVAWQKTMLEARRAFKQQELQALCQEVNGLRSRTRNQDYAMLEFLERIDGDGSRSVIS